MKRWHWIVIIVLTLLTLVGQYLEHNYWWEAIPGFFAVYGFVGSLILMHGAKFLAKKFISKKPDYYDDSITKEQDVKTNAH
ncbi:hypothetical protein SAMN05660653_02983 [Desulfonatronum thiosulfatophilum]|uniref:2TM domain-containing protein n=1 Tax=Desulfonatronum thiosulfatophilum TaxID=617002 RepID=A0A1G6EPS5_9BACT|nr:hypothetical protein [Desulfonatronum thiosulfatophilum]SDB58895.1 hypothetical protein SAMN05660653_02983 [Desulfonatronum thiosulfatophilum]